LYGRLAPISPFTFAAAQQARNNRFMAQVYVGIGTNVGNRRANIQQARAELDDLPQTKLVRLSKIYETAPDGPVSQDKFLNAVAELRTKLAPSDLLDGLAQIEARAGREDSGNRIKWGPRTLDLDILFYDDEVISTDDLVVPHPLMHERWFVLRPLCDLNPKAVHPLLQMTVGELLNYVEDKRAIADEEVD